MRVDFLIVGQGLAGTVLAHTLLQRGKTVLVIDDGHQSAASIVAAGMWNPIVFKRINKSWKADEVLPVMDSVYHDIGNKLGVQLIHKLDIIRIFPNQQAANEFSERSLLPGFRELLEPLDVQEFKGVPLPFGAGKVKGGGYVDLEQMLLKYRAELEQCNGIRTEAFSPDDLLISEDGVRWKDLEAGQVVFCQGFRNATNPWFSSLPLRTTKGEVLSLRSESPFEEILNNGRFLLPLGDGKFKLGATYEWHTEDPSVTDEARRLLLEKATPLLQGKTEVIAQKGGIRPTVIDRRPLLGRHPDHPSIAIFNGLGTRGVMIAPWLAEHLADHLIEGLPLDPEVDILRFLK